MLERRKVVEGVRVVLRAAIDGTKKVVQRKWKAAALSCLVNGQREYPGNQKTLTVCA